MPSTEIRVSPSAGRDDSFDVVVLDDGGHNEYRVAFDDWGRRTAAAHRSTREDLVDACFRFLLDREPREAILPVFRLSEIVRYFPEIEDRIGNYLG